MKVPADLAKSLRARGVKTEIFLDDVPMKKKLNYANKQGIPFVILIGDDEIRTDTYTVKNMKNGEQQRISANEVFKKLSAN